MEKDNKNLYVTNYGELLAQVNGYELVKFETDGGYQGKYLVVLTDGSKLFYYQDYYGSCGGCDWIQSEGEYILDNKYKIDYKKALEFCGEIKPIFIVPKNKPLEIVNLGDYNGFLLK